MATSKIYVPDSDHHMLPPNGGVYRVPERLFFDKSAHLASMLLPPLWFPFDGDGVPTDGCPKNQSLHIHVRTAVPWRCPVPVC